MARSPEIAYRRVSEERIEVMREGDAEAQYVARRHYLAYRRDEPGQSFDSMVGEYASLQDAVEACVLDAAAVAAWIEAGTGREPGFDGGLSFSERRAGEWVAREYDTIGADWLIEAGRWLVEDEVNGGAPVWLDDEDDLPAFIEREIDTGWF